MQIRDVMTTDPVVCPSSCGLKEAAATMRDRDIGDVLVKDEEGKLCGIVTDRDLVVRGLATDADLSSMTIGDVCAHELHTIQVDSSTDDAVKLMKARALRRIPVMEGDELVGIVSLGDLAEQLDADSALGTISGAPPD